MSYTLFLNGKKQTESNRIGILEYLREKTAGETVYIDDTEITVEDLVDTAINATVTIECEPLQIDDKFVDLTIVEH